MAERLYVLGHPVAHSKSPVMHNAAYQALGLDWSYGMADRASEDDARAFLQDRDWLACNVTMPWKPLALAFSDAPSTSAIVAGGANVLVAWDGRVHSDNTDGRGCIGFLQRCGVDFEGARVAVCGTGPTSLSIMHASAAAGAAEICLLGRGAERSQRVLDDYRRRLAQAGPAPECMLLAGAYDARGLDFIARSNVVMDATSLGMKPGDPAPFDTAALSAEQAVFDVVYGHGETALVTAAREAGCATFDGAGMLVAQAVETVVDIASITGLFTVPQGLDLFAVMAQAADFDLA